MTILVFDFRAIAFAIGHTCRRACLGFARLKGWLANDLTDALRVSLGFK